MHDPRAEIERRVTRVLAERLRPAEHEAVAPLTLEVWHVDGGQGEPVPFAEARRATYEPCSVGQPWGPAWGTSWFRLTGDVPPELDGAAELVVDLGWHRSAPGFQAEALVRTPTGEHVTGLHPHHQTIRVRPGRVELYVEAAANPTLLGPNGFQPTELGEKHTAGDTPLYAVARADVCRRHPEVAELVADVEVLDGLMRSLPDTDAWRWQLALGLGRALDALDLADVPGTATRARAELAPLLATPASPAAHRVTAIGHAHIDCAWLWPLRETRRKVARTLTNVLDLIEADPTLVYAMSSAQQYAWIEEDRPDLFDRVRRAVADGRVVPVGGMWVESDTNMVGGEAMIRQLLHGQRYFEDRFGVRCREVWLPDSFGYTAALPQLVRGAGLDRFLTQKISWSETNAFPHHTFWWEGIDGTRVFTHFPPVDTYTAELTPSELHHAATGFRDKGAASRSLVPFGYGDGGGGPTREMLARAARQRDLQGSPVVEIDTPASFFDAALDEYGDRAPVWVGELYLELHRGTYTSQARTKQGNRRSESLLREAELWATTAMVQTGAPYPYEQLDRLWKTVLLHQFHDILPGSSIAWVHREAAETYEQVTRELESLIGESLSALGEPTVLVNASPFAVDGVPALGGGPVQTRTSETTLEQDDDAWVLDNGLLRTVVGTDGVVTSVRDLTADREVLPPGGSANLLQLHPDHPTRWDAWDLDASYASTVTDLRQVESLRTELSDGIARVVVQRAVGTSRVTQTVELAPGSPDLVCRTEVDWHESEKVLKAAFDVDVHTESACYETQLGHVRRPTHRNTTWDEARFEVCAHRFVHVGEPGYGVAVTNAATYGHDVTRHERAGGGTSSRVRLTLLRAPRYPDPRTDQGRHVLEYALTPGVDVVGAGAAGYRRNLPLRPGPSVEPLVHVTDGALVEAVKPAEDRSGDVVIRLYEPRGARAQVTVTPSFTPSSVQQTNLLEEPADADALTSTDPICLSLRPFQVVTLRFTR